MSRTAPPVTERTAGFWQSGADGLLRIARCGDCGHYHHPPLPVCPRCHAARVGFEVVSGAGTVYSFTLNRYRWSPGLEPPYVLAEVDLVEQPGLRLLTAVVGCEAGQVSIGMSVRVDFEPAGAYWVPVFRP